MTSAPLERTDHKAAFAAAFPRFLVDDVLVVASTMPPHRLAPARPFPVVVAGERVAIPERVYNDEPDGALTASFSARQQTLFHCLYSRHHDGRVRQRHVEQIVALAEPWVVPFVVRLVGEYVVEIQRVIWDGLVDIDIPGAAQHDVYGAFLAANPAFLQRTRQQVASYWACYYRNRWPRKYYPGTVIVESLRDAARHSAAGRGGPTAVR
ncbi:MAG: hypothetical protein HOV66_02825 [Streptomycetaceae bacterium]|nr:hypothetical protein [Streptomycetaceae bacterium]